MAKTFEWIEHFESLDRDRLKELKGALETLQSDPMIKSQYADLGLFETTGLIRAIDFVMDYNV